MYLQKGVKSILILFFIFIFNPIYAQWQKIQGIYGGTVNTIFYSDNKIYAGLEGGGVYISTNNGESWQESNTGLTGGALSVYTINKIDSNILIGTSQGVYKSKVNSNLWESANVGIHQVSSTRINKIHILDSTIYLATDANLYTSHFYPLNWKLYGDSNNIKSYSSIASIGDSLIAIIENGIYVSPKVNFNWVKRDSGIVENSLSHISILGTLIILSANKGIYISSNNGLSWRKVRNFDNNIGQFTFLDGNKIITPDKDSGLIYSNDTGTSWNIYINTLYGEVIYCLSKIDNSLFIGLRNNGILKTIDSGFTWIQLNKGLNATSIISFIQNKNQFICSTTAGVYTSVNYGKTWILRLPNDGFYKNYFYSLTQHKSSIFCISNNHILRTNDYGITWLECDIGITGNIRCLYSDGNTLYAAGSGVYKSNDIGLSWTKIYEPTESIEAIIIYHSQFFASDIHGQLHWSKDNGISWSKTINNTFTTNQFYVIGEKLFSCAYQGLFFMDSTHYWMQLNDQFALRSIVSYNDILYTFSWNGVTSSTDNGKTWLPFNEGSFYENALYNNLPPGAIYFYDSTLYIGTYGQGLWRRHLSPITGVKNLSPKTIESISIYPNPSKGLLNIESEATIKSIAIKNSIGELVYSTSSNTKNMSINTNDFLNGMYIVEIQTVNNIYIKKVIVE